MNDSALHTVFGWLLQRPLSDDELAARAAIVLERHAERKAAGEELRKADVADLLDGDG